MYGSMRHKPRRRFGRCVASSQLDVATRGFLERNNYLPGPYSMMHAGVQAVKCHQKFKKCMAKVAKDKAPGFSTKCPIDIARKTMDQGMDLAIMLSQFAQGGLSDAFGSALQ